MLYLHNPVIRTASLACLMYEITLKQPAFCIIELYLQLYFLPTCFLLRGYVQIEFEIFGGLSLPMGVDNWKKIMKKQHSYSIFCWWFKTSSFWKGAICHTSCPLCLLISQNSPAVHKFFINWLRIFVNLHI